MIDDQSDPGSWQRALDRGCLAGRVFDHGPRVLPLADWICLIPGIPADWGSGDTDAPTSKPASDPFHKEESTRA